MTQHRSLKSFLSLVILTVSFGALEGCGKKSVSPAISTIKPKPTQDRQTVEEKEESDEGFYRAQLQVLNPQLAEKTQGWATVLVKGEDFKVEVEMQGLQLGVKHLQAIMTAGECPTAAADVNGDGTLTTDEAMTIVGRTLLPLDHNLRAQVAGMSYGPISDETGIYFYRRSAPLNNVLTDLWDVDNDEEDSLDKLKQGQKLRLSKRVVLISAVTEDNHDQTTPVACGRLERMGPQP